MMLDSGVELLMDEISLKVVIMWVRTFIVVARASYSRLLY